jgi:hypothetical protein
VTPLPADLAGLVERWPSLPAHIKAVVMALLATVGNDLHTEAK